MNDLHNVLTDYAATATAQRDDLIETMREIAAIGHDDIERPDHAVVRAMIVGMARAAVAKVDG